LIQSQKQDEDLVQWLSHSYWLVEAQLRALRKQRVKDTLLWLRNMEEFRTWIADQTHMRPLWIRGAPGVGKSTMAGYIIDFLQTLHPHSIVAFFFCKSDNERLKNARDIIQTLAYQCLENSSVRLALAELKKSGFRMDDKIGINLMFDKLLREPMRSIGKDVYIVLDGLDEADNNKRDDVEKRPEMDVLVECFSSLANAHILFVSRPPSDIVKLAPNSMIKSITSENEGDIETYVKDKINRSERLQRHFQRKGLDPVRFLVGMANGIFLWVVLVLQQCSKII
jgi:hypothetical protein